MDELRGEGTVYRQKGSRFFWLQWYAQGRRFTESSKSEDEKVARRLLRKRLASVESGELSGGSRESLASLYATLERDYTINQRKDLVNVKSRWENHLKPSFSGKFVSDVDAQLISEFIAKRQAEGAANATINRELAILKRCYKLAVKTGILKVGQQPYIGTLKERNVRKGFLKDEQYQALARETGKVGLWLRAMFEVGYTYGWRKSELLKLRVSQIDIGRREILLNPGETKTDQGRGAPMTDRVLELMVASISGKKPDDFVFTRQPATPAGCLFKYPNSRFWWFRLDYEGRHFRESTKKETEKEAQKILDSYIRDLPPAEPRQVCDFRDDWDRVTAAAGVPGLLFHDLRRTGVRNMRRNGISEKVAMTISGHKTRSVFERYNIVDPNDLSEAGRIMNKASLLRSSSDSQMDMHFQVSTKPN